MGDALDEILEGIRGISRLEKMLEQATDRFTQKLDLVRTELVALNEAKERDSVAICNLNKTVNAIQQDITNIAEKHSVAETKLHSLDNTANKNKERISKLESRVDKLEDLENTVRLLNEQEKRKNFSTVLKNKLQTFSSENSLYNKAEAASKATTNTGESSSIPKAIKKT